MEIVLRPSYRGLVGIPIAIGLWILFCWLLAWFELLTVFQAQYVAGAMVCVHLVLRGHAVWSIFRSKIVLTEFGISGQVRSNKVEIGWLRIDAIQFVYFDKNLPTLVFVCGEDLVWIPIAHFNSDELETAICSFVSKDLFGQAKVENTSWYRKQIEVEKQLLASEQVMQGWVAPRYLVAKLVVLFCLAAWLTLIHWISFSLLLMVLVILSVPLFIIVRMPSGKLGIDAAGIYWRNWNGQHSMLWNDVELMEHSYDNQILRFSGDGKRLTVAAPNTLSNQDVARDLTRIVRIQVERLGFEVRPRRFMWPVPNLGTKQ